MLIWFCCVYMSTHQLQYNTNCAAFPTTVVCTRASYILHVDQIQNERALLTKPVCFYSNPRRDKIILSACSDLLGMSLKRVACWQLVFFLS